ncbi:hypothetical protein Daus18300_001760 [Diaporthe australafricana]|uniref:Glyceraldehyde 3-phosphate dehydrogenase NAD(P) binding domain-containing protein n=1 Tax=Diaporthe australafricana TaxID=127596 RepID=A0ABR3XT54_9PEZI
MQEQFPGQEFPGDDPTNYLNSDTAPFDLPRSPGKVLDELGHEFRVGINGFGRLGRTIFWYLSYNTPYINIVAVNDPHVEATQAATLLQEEHSQGRLAPSTNLEIHAEAAASTLLLKDTATGKTATVQFSAQDDPSILGWASLGAFHVIECSGMFTTVAAASAHLSTGKTSGQPDDDGAGGAFKVLIAAASPDAPRFYPRVNLREYRVEQSVFVCAPPGGDEHLAAQGDNSAVDENHVWQYADHVLELLSESYVPCLYLFYVCFQV